MPLSTHCSIWTIVALVLAFGPLPTSADDESTLTLAINSPASLQPLQYPALSLRRDPFMAPVSLKSDPVVPEPIPGIDPSFVLPPNLGASADGSSPVGLVSASVRAVVVGESPKALLQIGSRTVFVGIGSHVGGSIVVEIDANSVRLSDGTRLLLAQSNR
ncbi:MAG TPA: hypothetical protein VGF98_03885 [Candidatus Tumulicola sp.]